MLQNPVFYSLSTVAERAQRTAAEEKTMQIDRTLSVFKCTMTMQAAQLTTVNAFSRGQ